jgi:hypothetical protein
MTPLEIEWLAEALARRMRGEFRRMIEEIIEEQSSAVQNAVGNEADRIARQIIDKLEKD